jgi:hypothetical protein
MNVEIEKFISDSLVDAQCSSGQDFVQAWRYRAPALAAFARAGVDLAGDATKGYANGRTRNALNMNDSGLLPVLFSTRIMI